MQQLAIRLSPQAGKSLVITTNGLLQGFLNKLEETGVSQKQAEAIAIAQSEAFAELTKTKDLTTKTDLHEPKYDLLKWIAGSAFAQLALLIPDNPLELKPT